MDRMETECDVNEDFGIAENIFQESSRDAKLAIFDLDTTDLSQSKEIIQISARYKDKHFNQCIIPNKDIEPISRRKNKFEIRIIDDERKLYHDQRMVNEAVGPKEGLTNFLDFLRELQTDPNNQKGDVLLVAHGCSIVDGATLVREMEKHDLFDTFQSLVLGFVDTIPVFKSKLPERVKNQTEEIKKNKIKNKEEPKSKRPKRNNEDKLYSFGLAQLATDYLDAKDIPAERNATENVKILQLLITELKVDDATIKQHAKSFAMFIWLMPENVGIVVTGLEALGNKVSKTMKEKIAKAGISIEKLIQTYESNGSDGVSALLIKVDVVKSKNKIQEIVDALKELSSKLNENALTNLSLNNEEN